MITGMDILLNILGACVGGIIVWSAWQHGYKKGMAVSSMVYRATQGLDPMPEPEPDMDSVDLELQEVSA